MSDSLPKALLRKQFTYHEARDQGLTQYALQKLLNVGAIERLERGTYRTVDEDLSDEELFRNVTKRVGDPAVVCLLSALSYYELTDLIPRQVWLMVPKEKRVKSSGIKLYRARNPRWKIGVISRDGYSITSLERTIVDAMTLRAVISPRIGIDALKAALTTRKTSANKLIRIAAELGVKHRILPYIEALV